MKKNYFYKFVKIIFSPLFYILFIPTIKGKENIPKDGGVILAGNHTSYFDAALLVFATKRQVHFLAKKELLEGPLAFIFRWMGIIPVDRKNKNPEVYEKAIDVLNNNGTIGIFPESTINKTTDTILPFKIGAVKMASESASWVIPFAITGKYKLFRKSINIEFGKAYKTKENDLNNENKLLEKYIIQLLEKE